jgi:hypothetical protein
MIVHDIIHDVHMCSLFSQKFSFLCLFYIEYMFLLCPFCTRSLRQGPADSDHFLRSDSVGTSWLRRVRFWFSQLSSWWKNDGKLWKTREKMTCLTEKICERNLRRLILKCHAAIHHFRIDETRWLKDSRDKLKSNQWTNMNKRQISRKSLKAHSKRQQNKKLDLSRLFQWSCCLYPHLALWSVLPQRNTQKEQIRLEEFRNSKKSKNSDRQFIETFNAVLNESLDWMIQLRW